MIVNRLDYHSVTKCKVDDKGFLQGEAPASRAGVFTYRNLNGSTRLELRHPDDVFKADSLKTLEMLVITDDHPASFVTANTAKNLSVGFTGQKISIQDNNIITPLTITDKEVVTKILNGKTGLSYGYTADVIEESGVFNGEKYTHRQTNIKYNHLAVVDNPRAGHIAHIRIDSGDDTLFFHSDTNDDDKSKEVHVMSDNKEKNDTLSEKDLIIAERETRIDKLNAELALVKMQYETELKKAKSFEDLWSKEKNRCDEALKSIDQKEINKQVQDRCDLFIKTTALTGIPAADLLHHDNEEIQKIVLKHNLDDTEKHKIDSMSGEYLKGAFDRFCDDKLGQDSIRYKADAAMIINARNSDFIGSSSSYLKKLESKFNTTKASN